MTGTPNARYWLLVPLLTLAITLTGCGPGRDETTTPASAPDSARAAAGAGQTVTVTLAARPFQLHIPGGYSQGNAAPLVVLLHGYQASGAKQEAYLKLTAESDKRGFLYAYPDGTKDPAGSTFWNATDACCNFYGSSVDDSGYVSGIITAVEDQYTVDARRVYLIGHSNGAFMSYRVSCDHADQITAIVSLAGAMWTDTSRCHPSRPVSILEIHGTADEVIPYNGGAIQSHAYPAVATTVADWLHLDGCDDAPAMTAPAAQDLVADVVGAETTATVYATGCQANTRVELWTMNRGPHVPQFTAAFGPAIIDFLYAQVAP